MNDVKIKDVGRFTVSEDYSTVCLIKPSNKGEEKCYAKTTSAFVRIHDNSNEFITNDCILTGNKLSNIESEQDVVDLIEKYCKEIVIKEEVIVISPKDLPPQDFDITQCSEAAQKLARMTRNEFILRIGQNKGKYRYLRMFDYYMWVNHYDTFGEMLKDPPVKVMSGRQIGEKKMKEFIRFLKDNGIEPTDCGEWGKLVAELRD